MARLPYPIYGLENLYLFRRYQTRADYQQATGAEAPPFDPTKRPKYWFDPTAKDSSRRNVVYDNVLVVSEFGKPIPGPDGKPMLDLLTLPKMEAATVNIPPEGTNIEGTDKYEELLPLRDLEPGEELIFQFGGLVAVKNVELFDSLKEGFTAGDRTLLESIARKLGA